jgi:WD40 repeat protein
LTGGAPGWSRWLAAIEPQGSAGQSEKPNRDMTSMKRESMESLAEGSVQDYDRGGQQGGLGGPTPPSVPGSIITHGHIFGMKGDVAGGLQYVDESTLAYPCGHSVVLLNLETREQKLVPGTGKGGITAMALAPNGRYLALAESAREDEGIAAGVNLFDVATQRRRKMMMSPELGSRKIVSTTFSLDGRMCAVQGGSPSWNLLVWSAEKSPKILHSIRTSAPSAGGEEAMPVAQISFSPRTTGSLLLCVTGDRVLRFFRVGDGQCKPMSLNIKSELQSYTCHAWTSPDVVVVGARTGGLLVIDGYESKGIIPAPAQVEGGVSSLVAYSKGIVAGFDDGSVCIYEACEDGRLAFKCVKVFHLSAAMPGSPPPRPLTFSVSPTEDYMAIITDELQLLSFNLSNTDILKEDGANNFDQICTSFHSCSRAPPSLSEEDEKRWRAAGGGSARVNSVDVCVWKPLVASVGADQTLRLWNHVDRRVELLKRLPEEAKSVALHPSGMYLSLAYQERVRLYSVVIDDIREVKDWPSKTCRSQAFSRGGQYLAIATGSQVQIINTFTAGTVAVLKGHQGHVVNITWQDTEQHIMTATSEGQLIVWDVLSGKRIPGNFSIRSGLTCAGAFPDFSRQYCAGSDGLVRELNVLQVSVVISGILTGHPRK